MIIFYGIKSICLNFINVLSFIAPEEDILWKWIKVKRINTN